MFCWLGWKQPSSVNGPTVGLGAVTEAGLGLRRVAEMRRAPVAHRPTRTSRARRSRVRRRAPRSPVRGTAGTCPVPPSSACSRAARSGSRPRRTRGRDANRRPAPPTSAGSRTPQRWSDANRKSPDRSPVKIRPVRLPPCAAGRETEDQHAGVGIAEPGHGSSPVLLVGEPRDLDPRDLLAPPDEPGTRAARDDLGLDHGRARARVIRGAGTRPREDRGTLARPSVSGRRPVPVSMNVRSDHPSDARRIRRPGARQDRADRRRRRRARAKDRDRARRRGRGRARRSRGPGS